MDWYDMFVITYLIIFVADQIIDLRGKKKKNKWMRQNRERRGRQSKRERERESDAIKIVYVNAENNFFFCRVFY